jgi:hypothetical protein
LLASVKDALRPPLRGRLRRSLTEAARDFTLAAGRGGGTGSFQSKQRNGKAMSHTVDQTAPKAVVSPLTAPPAPGPKVFWFFFSKKNLFLPFP